MKRMGVVLAAVFLLARASSPRRPFPSSSRRPRPRSRASPGRTLSRPSTRSRPRPRQARKRDRAASSSPRRSTFYRGVCEANLGHRRKRPALYFATFLALQPNASMDPSMYSKKAVAAFDAARASVAPPPDADDGRLSMFGRFQEFKLPRELRRAGQRPVGRRADPVDHDRRGEAHAGRSCLAGGERQEFVDRFWEARNPQPGNPDNIFTTAFERRVAFADAHFVQAEGDARQPDRPRHGLRPARASDVRRTQAAPNRRGRQRAGRNVGSRARGGAERAEGRRAATARAPRVIRLAAADEFSGPGTRAADSSTNWREIWHYRKELLPKGVRYQQVDVEFVTKTGYGVNVMQPATQTLATLEAARGEPRQN